MNPEWKMMRARWAVYIRRFLFLNFENFPWLDKRNFGRKGSQNLFANVSSLPAIKGNDIVLNALSSFMSLNSLGTNSEYPKSYYLFRRNIYCTHTTRFIGKIVRFQRRVQFTLLQNTYSITLLRGIQQILKFRILLRPLKVYNASLKSVSGIWICLCTFLLE